MPAWQEGCKQLRYFRSVRCGGVFEMRGIDLQSTSTREGRIAERRDLKEGGSTQLRLQIEAHSGSIAVDMSRHNEIVGTVVIRDYDDGHYRRM